MIWVDRVLLMTSLVLYAGALAGYFMNFFYRPNRPEKIWRIILLSGYMIHTVEMIRQGMVLVQSSIMTLLEVFVFLSWALVALTIFLQTRVKLRVILSILLASVVVIGLSALSVSRYVHKAIPSFNAFWFGTHIVLSLMGYVAFFVAFISSIIYLVVNRQLKLKKTELSENSLPPLEALEWLSFRSLWSGVILLGLGLIHGVFWVFYSHISLSWTDPKVIAAGCTFLIYSLILYFRYRTCWRGKKVAWLSCLGFASVLITFFVMNYFSKGHGFF